MSNAFLPEACPDIVKGLAEIDQRSRQRIAKSCTGNNPEVSFLTNPNLEKKRVTEDIIMLLTDTSRLLSAVTSMKKDICSGKIPRLDQLKTVSSGACVGGCGPNGIQPVDSYIPYDMIKYVAGFNIPYEFMECNELGDPVAVESTIRAMMLTSIRNEMEQVFIYGDEDLPTGPGQSDENNLLGVNDGILKIACQCAPQDQIIDAQGAGLSRGLYMAMQQAVPVRYRQQSQNWRYIQGYGATNWYREHLAGGCSEAADQTLRSGEIDRIWGRQIFEVPTWNESRPYGPEGSEVEVSDILFTSLSNLVYLYKREFDMSPEYNRNCDVTEYLGYWTQDAIIMDPDALVICKNVSVCGGTPYAGCYEGC